MSQLNARLHPEFKDKDQQNALKPKSQLSLL